jgi:hypothetical protein
MRQEGLENGLMGYALFTAMVLTSSTAWEWEGRSRIIPL